MFPKEHGAYGQLVFPMVAALIVAGPSTGGLLVAVAAVAGFLAHEPAAVLLGWRGSRARREGGRDAVRWLLCSGLAGLAGAAGALLATPAHVRPTLLIPLPAAAVLVAAAARGREKTALGETAVAITFSLVAVPIAAAAGLALRPAFAIAVPFVALFVASTLAVRVVILRVRGGGAHAGAAGRTRAAAALFVACGITGLVVGYTFGLWPLATILASLPGLAVSAVVAARPPAPTRLRRIGWTLVAVSFVTTLIVVAA